MYLKMIFAKEINKHSCVLNPKLSVPEPVLTAAIHPERWSDCDATADAIKYCCRYLINSVTSIYKSNGATIASHKNTTKKAFY